MPENGPHIRTRVSSGLTDEAVFEQFLLGDDRAYTELYGRYDAGVLTYLRTILRDSPVAADDLFQETFVRLFRERKRRADNPGAYAAVRSVRAWLFRVAHNLAISHLRANRLMVSISEGDSDRGGWDERLMVPIEESFAELYGDDAGASGERLHEQLRKAVDLLPPSLRDVYVLREINGLEYEQVAEIAGCTQEAARMRISRARRALRKALERWLSKESR